MKAGLARDELLYNEKLAQFGKQPTRTKET
jgi:hypothetical protein